MRNIFFCHCCLFLFNINRIEMQQKKFVELVSFGLKLSNSPKKSLGRKKFFKFHIQIWSNLLCFGAVWDVQPTAAEMPFAQIGASMRQRRRNGVKLVPGGGWARSTLQEVGRRNWIPARSKRQHLEGTGTGIKHDAFSQSNMSYTILSKCLSSHRFSLWHWRRETQKCCFFPLIVIH